MKRSLAFLLFIMLSSGCLSVETEILSDAEIQTRIAQTITAPNSLITPTKQVYDNKLPPTWTPTPSVIPSETPTLTPSPVVTPIIGIPQSSITPMPARFTLRGSGNLTTSDFALPHGRAKISWNYAGSTSDSINLNYAHNVHQINLNYLQNWLNIWQPYYEDILARAVDDRDAIAIRDAQAGLSRVTKEYKQRVKEENARYDAEKARYQTTFTLKINRRSADQPKILASGIGGSSGTATYQATGAYDYYFTIQASGSWVIQINP